MYLQKTRTTTKDFKNYRQFITKREWENLKKTAKKLRKKKIIHINATQKGGGVAEILKSLVPLERSMGIDSSWYCISADSDFYHIAKKLFNGAQGADVFISEEQKQHYLDFNEKFANELKKIKADLIIIHDPHPLAISEFYYDNPLILRIHPDLSAPNKNIMKFLLRYMNKYQASIFSLPQYAPEEMKKKANSKKIYISPPCIDPLTKKNEIIDCKKYKAILAKIGVNYEKPLIAQVSRFDMFKNPIGVVKAFYMAKEEIPDLQLVLSGIIEAKDDPTAYEILEDVKEYAKASEDIVMFHNLNQLKKLRLSQSTLIKVVQNCANPILQLSIREGFGLTVTEAMWRGKVVIGGDVGGIKLQIQDGENGFLVNSPEEAARKIVEIIKDPDLAKKIGANARKTVKKNFLITKLLADHLEIYSRNL